MDGRDFVRMVKHEAVDDTLRVTIKALESPRQLKPVPDSTDPIQIGIAEFYNKGALDEQRKAAFYRGLTDEQRKVFVEILQDCVELSALSFCCLIDGVGGNWEGVFKVYAVDAREQRTLLNPENSDMLHDLLSEVCAEDR